MIHRAPDVTRMLDRLVRQHLVARVRNPDDRRESIATITKAGSRCSTGWIRTSTRCRTASPPVVSARRICDSSCPAVRRAGALDAPLHFMNDPHVAGELPWQSRRRSSRSSERPARRAAGWCARSWPIRSGAFAARAHHAPRRLGQGEGAAAARRRGRGGRPRRPEEPRARRSPARTARSASRTSGSTSRPRRSWPRRATMAQAAKAAGVQHVDLVHARGHAEVGAARRRPDADADGQVQGAALRRQGRGRPVLPRARRADHVPADRRSTGTTSSTSALGPAARARRQAGAHASRWTTRSCPASPWRTSARRAYGIFKRGQGVHRQDASASRAST